MIIDFDFLDDWDDLDDGTAAIDEQELTGFDDGDETDLTNLPMESNELNWPSSHDITQDDGSFDIDGEDSQPTSTLSPHRQFAQLRFGGGCDCGYNPLTCCAGYACRWQY